MMRTSFNRIKMLNSMVFTFLALVLAGCGTRSISDSGYRGSYGRGTSSNPFYQGELSELDILGTVSNRDATDASIAKELESARPPVIQRGEKLILIQSGAPLPDRSMLEEAERCFAVAPFSGIPPADRTGLSASLRLRAAQGGYRYILCYWGVLESAQTDNEGRVVSWLPFAGHFVPDQKQQMRMRLKGVLLDVGSGHWRMILPAPVAESRISSEYTRESSDQRLVEALKSKGYKSLMAEALRN